MTQPGIIPSGQTGPSLIRFKPVYHKGEIQLWDCYVKDKWIGSRRLLRFWLPTIKRIREHEERLRRRF